ncbi:probable DNA-directed RNA polymerase I subunit RPA43 [Apis florea]|uniref:probable DNA-directed RNA polymerase I subunit RPA43 n=1 Tax=Apis florea TaxID=7463 RepID=UPI0012FF5521|nr:probable DNA-directed RNA polymerase I subunit RPA43 [Apis florea]
MVQNQIIENVKPTTCLYRQNVKPMKSVKISKNGVEAITPKHLQRSFRANPSYISKKKDYIKLNVVKEKKKEENENEKKSSNPDKELKKEEDNEEEKKLDVKEELEKEEDKEEKN